MEDKEDKFFKIGLKITKASRIINKHPDLL